MADRKTLRESDPMSLDIEGLFLLQGTLVSELLQVNNILEGRCRIYPTLSDELRRQLDHEADQLRLFSDELRQELRRDQVSLRGPRTT